MRFLLCALLGLTSLRSLAAAPDPYPVVPVEQARAPRPPVPDEAYWAAAGLGFAHVITYNSLAYNLGLYGSASRFVYGIRVNGTDGVAQNDVRYGNEQALMLGYYLDHSNMTWAGIGVSR